MLKNKNIIDSIIFLALIASLALSVMWFMQSCGWKMKMQKSESSVDSTHVTFVDSSWFKTLLEKSQYSKTGLKETFYVPAPNSKYDSLLTMLLKEQNVENIKQIQAEMERIRKLTPINNFYYSRETSAETGSTEKQIKDSGDTEKKDSTGVKTDNKSKWSQFTAGISLPLIILAGIVVIGFVILYFKASKK